MSFDALTLISLSEINVFNRIYFANIPYRKCLIYVLLFPNFQRTFGLFRHPIFRPGCKGKSLYEFNQIFLLFLEDFSLRFVTRFFEELSLFLKADGKDTRSYFITKFFFTFLKSILDFVVPLYSLFLLTVCKELTRFLLPPELPVPAISVASFLTKSALLSGAYFKFGLQR